MPKYLIFPMYSGALALLTFILVPRKEIRRLAIYAMIFGGMFDVVAILFFTKLLGIGGYINYRNFGAFGIPLFPPVSWVAYYIMFLYILPRQKPWKYVFPVIAACFSLYFSYVLQELGIFKWNYGGPLLHLLIIYLPWECGVAWFYLRSLEGKENKERIPKHYFIPAPAMKKEQRRKGSFVKPKKL